MSNEVSSNISRKSGDTHPSKSVIEINSIPMDLTDWHVDLRYKKDDVEWVINCIVTDAKEGKVSIYPHGRTRVDADNEGTR